MSRVPRISDAEWDVMNVVWGKSPITSNEIVEMLAQHRDWNHRTIRTMLNRLVRKGALAFEISGNAYLYRPAVSKAVCVREESNSFLSRIFSGSAAPLLVHFVENTKLSRKEIQELKKLLSEKAN